MKRVLFTLLIVSVGTVQVDNAVAQTSDVLHIASDGREEDLQPFITAFEAAKPDIDVIYVSLEPGQIYQAASDAKELGIDLIVSISSDLQMKIVNDGYALTHSSPQTEALPGWANWGDAVFGFTFEPAVIVYNPSMISREEVPRTHVALAQMLERQPRRFNGRVITYDIERSAVGYLLATNDQFISSNFWRLVGAMASVDVTLAQSSFEMLEAVSSGQASLAYNVLGSHAYARRAFDDGVRVVVPDDFVIVLTRSMVIPVGAERPDLAGAFIDFALSEKGQEVAAGAMAFGAIVGDFDGYTLESISARGLGAIQPVEIGPVMLSGLDMLRRQNFLTSWRNILERRTNGVAAQ